MESTLSITIGDGSESRVGCEIIRSGDPVQKGMHFEEVMECKARWEARGVLCELISLNEASGLGDQLSRAYLLVGRGMVGKMASSDALYGEIDAKPLDTKMKSYGKVLNRHCHYTCIFGPERYENLNPDYSIGQGYVHNTDAMPLLSKVMSGLPEWLGPKFADRSAELNNYFGPKCTIRFHGDAERKIVFCIRLGQPRPLYFQAFDKSGFPIGNRITVQLSHGDGYLMSDQAVPQETLAGECPSQPTLHCFSDLALLSPHRSAGERAALPAPGRRLRSPLSSLAERAPAAGAHSKWGPCPLDFLGQYAIT